MSTKVYSGFRINTTDLSKIQEIVNNFKPWVQEESLKVPVFYLRHAKDPNKTLIQAYTDWELQRHKLEKEGYTSLAQYDTKFSILFIPCDGFTLGCTYTAHKDWHNQWLKEPGVIPYEFWNNTDAPDSVSDQEWEQREKDWSILTGEAMSMQGFIIETTSPWGPDISKALDLYRKMYGNE